MIKKILPRTLRSQIVWLLLSSLLIAQSVSFFLIIGERSLVSMDQRIDQSLNEFFTFADLVDATPDYLHDDLLLSINDPNRFFRLNEDFQLMKTDPLLTQDNRSNTIAQKRLLQRIKDTDFRMGNALIIITPVTNNEYEKVNNSYAEFIAQHEPSGLNRWQQWLKPELSYDRIDTEVQLASGLWLYGSFKLEKLSTGIQIMLLGLTLLTVTIVSLVGVFIILRMTKPISSLADASEKLGKGQVVDRLEEIGSADIRHATSAFNTMNTRVMLLLENQKQMLGDISHDLRSPLTSLRLRLENLDDGQSKEKMISTVDEMNGMIASILTFTRQQADENHSEATEKVELKNFFYSLIEEYTDTHRDCHLDYNVNQVNHFECRYISLRRALRNIIDNGLRYGNKVNIIVTNLNQRQLNINIRDNGPGIPEQHLNDVLKPFFRPDQARAHNDGGIGMGLAISESIITSHGGVLKLGNHPEGGVEAFISLPL